MRRKREDFWVLFFAVTGIFIFLCGCQAGRARPAAQPTPKRSMEGSLEVIRKEGSGDEPVAKELAELEAKRRAALERGKFSSLLQKKEGLKEKISALERASSETSAVRPQALSTKEKPGILIEPTSAEKSSATSPETAPSETATEKTSATSGPGEDWLESKYSHIRERTEPDGSQTLFYHLRHRGGAVITESEIKGQRLVIDTEKVDLKTLEGLLQNWLSHEGKVISDKDRNMLIITDAPEYIELAKELLLKVFDTPERQVLIEANIFEYSRNWDFQLGQEWTATRFRNMKAAFQDFTTSFGIPGSLTPPWTGSKGTVEFLLASDEWGVELDVVIGFLEEQGWVNAIATPRVATQEGKTAMVEIGEELPVVTQVEVLRGQVSSKTEFKFVGVKLFITPLIIGDEMVKLHIIAEVSQVTSFEVIGIENPIPIARIDSRVAQSTVTVRNGRTLVMGGLRSNEEVEREVKVPLLGDIPIIGWLFKGYRKATVERNLVFTLKPTIIKEPTQAEMVMPAAESP
ncbi:MAG: hypothetical protein AMS15_02515 [Planctomycetes bacterium DG_23]|nr:MAG: hypothetical protein AMS15_02515 [Planctomycetes bacterium DG_23]